MIKAPRSISNKPVTPRNYALDMLRGVCAIAVATYHINMWMEGSLAPPLNSFLTWCGLYGVSIFFLLSGYSLAIAYQKKFSANIDYETAAAYFRRRLGRLLPLFILAIALSVAGKLLITHKSVSIYQIAANATLLFGFVSPTETPVVGGWSIGIEAVFYVVLPLLLLMKKKIAVVLAAALLVTFWISGNIATCLSLSTCWNEYVNPANHFIFFVIGVYLRMEITPIFNPPNSAKLIIIALAISITFFGALGASDIELVTGWRRALFLITSTMLVLGLANLKIDKLNQLFEYLGRISYPLYLMHPVVFFALKPLISNGRLSAIGLFAIIAVSTAMIDRLFDKPIQTKLIRLGW